MFVEMQYEYARLQDSPDTSKILNYCRILCDSFNCYRAAYDLTEYFLHYRRLDSAKYYLDIFALDTMHVPWSKQNYWGLEAEYYRQLGHYKRSDSVAHILTDFYLQHEFVDKSNEVSYITQNYERQKAENEKLKHKLHAQKLVFLTIFLVLIIVFLTIYYRQQIANFMFNIQHKNRELVESRQTGKKITEEYIKHLIDQDMQNLRLARKNNTEKDNVRINWTVISSQFENMTEGLLSALEAEYGIIKDIDKQIIMLTYLDFEVADIATLCKKKEQTIYNHRSQLMNLFKCDKTLSIWLKEYK